MRAIVQDAPGGPEVMRVGEAPAPTPGPGELLIHVCAVGVNRADCLQRAGGYDPPPGASRILGLELAGRVVGLGEGVTRFKEGDRVMSLVTGGAYAELATAPEATSLPVPDELDWATAGAIPEAFLTAWLNLYELAQLEEDESVLVHAAASGVGIAAIQLARGLGATAFATASSEEKLAFARDHGASGAFTRHSDWAGQVRAASPDGKGVDVVLDFVGAPYWNDNLKVLRKGGRLCLIGFLGGREGNLDLGAILGKSLTVRGTTLRRSPERTKARITRAFGAFALKRFADSRLRAPIHALIDFDEAPLAHAMMERNENLGKIVLAVDEC